jgi:hypothetical protein
MSEFTPDEKRRLESWAAPAVPDGFLDRVVAARAAESRAERQVEVAVEVAPEARRSRPWALWAAAVVLLAVGAALLVGIEPTADPTQAQLAPVVLPPAHPAVQAAWVTVETARLEAQDAPVAVPAKVPVVEDPAEEIPPMILGE